MDELTMLRINRIIDFIDRTTEDVNNVSKEEFIKSSLLQRATCFSVEQIGEMMNKLSKTLARSYPNLPWDLSYATRIVIAHHYEDVDFERIYNIIRDDLPPLKTQLLKILDCEA